MSAKGGRRLSTRIAKWTAEVTTATRAMNRTATMPTTFRSSSAQAYTATIRPTMKGIMARIRSSSAVNHGSPMGSTGEGSVARPMTRHAR